jgi:hypothetical protein
LQEGVEKMLSYEIASRTGQRQKPNMVVPNATVPLQHHLSSADSGFPSKQCPKLIAADWTSMPHALFFKVGVNIFRLWYRNLFWGGPRFWDNTGHLLISVYSTTRTQAVQ